MDNKKIAKAFVAFVKLIGLIFICYALNLDFYHGLEFIWGAIFLSCTYKE